LAARKERRTAWQTGNVGEVLTPHELRTTTMVTSIGVENKENAD